MATAMHGPPKGYTWGHAGDGWGWVEIVGRPGLSFGQDVFGDQAEYDNQHSQPPTVRCPHCGANLATPDKPSAHSNH